MGIPPLQNVFVMLNGAEGQQVDALCPVVSRLLRYGNLTANLYLIGGDIAEAMPQVEQIQRTVGRFLKENRLNRIYIHFAHRLGLGGPKDVTYYYQYYYESWKRTSWGFDREGFAHQEVPRLMLLPILCPDKGTAPDVLSDLLDLLKKAFFLPSLYLEEDTVDLTGQPGVTEKAEKIYVAVGDESGSVDIVHTLCSEAILEDLSTDLESRSSPVDAACPPAIILSAAEEKAYGCLEGFSQHFPLMAYAKNPDVETLMGRYGEAGRMVQNCLACKEARITALTEVPMTAQRAKECGALFYRFGMRHQEALDYTRAVESFNRSLRLSPEAEAPAIWFRLGLCLRNKGLPDQALDAFEKSRPAYGDRHYFHFYTGLCYYEKGDLAAAVKGFSEAAAMGSDTEDAVSILIYLGTCYNGLGRYREALASLGQAKALAPDVKEIYSMSGFSHYKLGEYDEAVKNLERAIDIDPDSAMDYASLGANYREMGELETAASMFEKALELDADLVHARTGLEELRQRL